ncbi:MAG: alpha/beta hydrolase family protein, partial [Actinomycetes bacterium]
PQGIASTPQPEQGRRTHRRRWPWIVVGVVAGLLVLGMAAALWVISGMIGDGARVPQPDAGYPMTITSIEGDQVSYTGVPSGWTDQGSYALRTSEGGYSLSDAEPIVTGDGAGTRTVTDQVTPPALAAGQSAALDGWYYGADPGEVLGLPYREVTYPAPGGPTAAWLIPGTSSTWVVYAHGRGDLPAQGLRMAHAMVPLGYPMLLIQYRNDPQGPGGSGYAHFGTDEWADLEAAVQYALDQGAERVVLAGTSMAGAMALAMLETSPLADRVVAVVGDAPAVDFGATVRRQTADMGLPGFVTDLAMRIASLRFGMDWGAMDYVARAGDLSVPMLITQGAADTSALPDRAAAFAAAAPTGRVTLETFPETGHTLAWNTDRERFEALVTGFLDRVAPAAGGAS